MLESFAVTLPLTMAVVLVISGLAKLRHPDDLSSWQQLGVPAALRQRWLLRLHPWGEIALGLALALLGGVLGVLAAIVCVVLMAAYTWVVVNAVRRPGDTECACFGSRKPVTRVTIVRNAWLTLVAVATAGVIWTTPLFGGAIAAGVAHWPWIAAAVVAAITAALIVWPTTASDSDASASLTAPRQTAGADTPDGEGMLQYVRTRTPAVPVALADGTIVNLRALASRKPILLLAVSDTCGACAEIIGQTPRFRELLPELDVRLLVMETPERSSLADTTEPQSLHDPEGYVRGSIADWPVPTAVLLGVDGMLAGGPETGVSDIEAFVDDIYESLHGTRPV